MHDKPEDGNVQSYLLLMMSALHTAGSVLLRDVQVLTLYKDRYTAARRSSPVPQLQCVGGSAGCQAFIPEVVQCLNKGWDGVDVQVRRESLVVSQDREMKMNGKAFYSADVWNI